MLKKTNNIDDIIKILDQKKDFDNIKKNIVMLFKQDFNILIKEENIILSNNVLKIKTSSNNKFLIYLNLLKINNKLKTLNYITVI